MPPRLFQPKHVLTEAMQLTQNNREEIVEWVGKPNLVDKAWDPVNLHINTGHGVAVCEVGSWVLKDPQGKFYPIDAATFAEKYEPATPQQGIQAGQTPQKPQGTQPLPKK